MSVITDKLEISIDRIVQETIDIGLHGGGPERIDHLASACFSLTNCLAQQHNIVQMLEYKEKIDSAASTIALNGMDVSSGVN